MADLLPENDFVKALLADCEAFEAGVKVRLDALNQLCAKSVANQEAGNQEVKDALAMPARG